MNSNCPQSVEHLSQVIFRDIHNQESYQGNKPFMIGKHHFCVDDNTMIIEGHRQTIQPKVMELAKLFANQQGKIVSREQIETSLWPREIVGLDSVNNTIARLRRLLGDNPRAPRYIETIPRIGYRLKISSLSIRQKTPFFGIGLLQQSNKKLVSGLILFGIAVGSFSYNFNMTPPEQMILHRSAEHQEQLLAENMTVNELIQKYDIILKDKKK